MTESKKNIGLIGLGLVGQALAERLLAAGFAVVGHDVVESCRTALQQLGGEAVNDMADVARRCPRLLLSLPTSPVAAVVLENLLPHLRPDAIVIDTTTGEPGDALQAADLLRTHGVHYCAATLVGSSVQIRNGDGLILAGGDAAALARCADLFTVLGKQTFATGDSGSAARMKLVVNLVLGLNRAALAEGLTFAAAVGVEPRQALAVLKAGAAYSAVMDSKGEKMLTGDFSPQARLAQHAKDVGLILQQAAAADLPLPLTATHQQLLAHAMKLGYGDQDNSAIIQALRQTDREAENDTP